MVSACIYQDGDAYFLIVKFNDKIIFRVSLSPEFYSLLVFLGFPICS
ncbi:exosporium protein G [Bacillus pseudomycoides]|uniref:Exosporium protein G n=1 Tax=Bacillus pseudomycoides TaxID=64104 RepID=A0ABD6T3P0_9BACI|nr:exosporium protein G [Bacillus pseudomycoides]MCX2829728.1 exosporium protein G [Bacillus sp. DHT2]AIK35621.1 hypothetical protein DJ92_5643 [Bacillus pseudomycoides]PDY00238.1 exosporium protein G [Bacillus pseudomycoides]PDY08562.1 exosporium protein G [Bacillus pseudomycoides]PEB39354.1 exosporium protein G [Bacillus pseudomycoides]